MNTTLMEHEYGQVIAQLIQQLSNSLIRKGNFAYYYECKAGATLRDVIWYNSEVWFAKRDGYKVNIAGVNYMETRLEIVSITY